MYQLSYDLVKRDRDIAYVLKTYIQVGAERFEVESASDDWFFTDVHGFKICGSSLEALRDWAITIIENSQVALSPT